MSNNFKRATTAYNTKGVFPKLSPTMSCFGEFSGEEYSRSSAVSRRIGLLNFLFDKNITNDEIDINKIIKQKCEADPEFGSAFRQASAELDLIAQLIMVRKEKGLTQKEVADKAGLTQQMVSRIESREFPPNYRNLVKIADVLDSKLQLVSKDTGG